MWGATMREEETANEQMSDDEMSDKWMRVAPPEVFWFSGRSRVSQCDNDRSKCDMTGNDCATM
jgi:hypothetical protein